MQVSPLRCAPVEMTNFGWQEMRFSWVAPGAGSSASPSASSRSGRNDIFVVVPDAGFSTSLRSGRNDIFLVWMRITVGRAMFLRDVLGDRNSGRDGGCPTQDIL